jgi:hypothetical protein
VVLGAIPDTAAYVPYEEAPVHVLASANDFAFNLGHAMYDFLLPVFNLMHVFHTYDPRFQLLLYRHGGEHVMGYSSMPGERLMT